MHDKLTCHEEVVGAAGQAGEELRAPRMDDMLVTGIQLTRTAVQQHPTHD